MTCGTTRYLRRTLEGVRAQTWIPTRVVVVDIWSPGRDIGTGQSIQAIVTDLGLDSVCKVRVVQAPQARTFGEAVRRGLELNALAQQRADRLHETRTGEIPIIRDDTSPGWLWLLHDDSAPDPAALERLVRAGESGPSIAVAGAKQRDWHVPDRLLEVGIHSTASARRYNPIDDDEIDQGQRDDVEDVLAVGLAGALVRRDVWSRLGGTDPALGPFGDGLEFCRRTRRAGFRVIVVPGAVVFHARASYLGLRSYGHASQDAPVPDIARSFSARRRAQLYNWILATSAVRLPFLLLWLLVLTPARALARFVQKDMVRARAELSAGAAVLSRPDLWLAARRRLRRSSVLPAAALAPLETDAREIRRARRQQRRARASRHTVGPTDLDLAEKAALAGRRRAGATVVALATLATTAAGVAPLLGLGALSGGALLPGDLGVRELAELAFSWWIPTGDGVPGPADPILTVALVPLAMGMSLSTAASAVVLLGVPAAALSAWGAAGAATRSVALRMWAAVAWAFTAVTAAATAQGRVSAMVAHVGLPLVALLTVRALGLQRRDRVASGASSLGAAAGAALVLAAVVAAAPILAVPALVVFAALTAFSPQRRTVWFIPVPALVLSGPWLTAVISERAWHALAASPGVPLRSEAAEPWQVALGLPAAGASPLVIAPGAVLAALSVLALLRGTGRARGVRVGWVLVVLGVATALAASRVAVAVDADGQVVHGWPGPGVSLMTLGLLLAVATAADGLREALSRHPFGLRHLAAGLVATLAAAGVVAAGVAWVLSVRADQLLAAAPDSPVPAISTQVAESPDRGRTLVLSPAAAGVTAELWRSNGPQLQHTSTLAAARRITDLPGAVDADRAAADLAGIVAEIVAGRATDAGERLASHAIAVVLVPPGAPPALLATLEATPGLARVAETGAGTAWRVATDGREGAAWTVARLRLALGDVVTAVPAGRIGASAVIPEGPAGRQLVLAERADPGWRAAVDGVPLAAVDGGWQQVFAVPTGGGRVVLTHDPPLRRPWLAVQAVVGAATLLLALPIRRRREGE